MIIDYNVTIPTRDGVKLYGNIYRPADRKSEKLPVILNYCVYGKDGGIEISMFPPSSNLDAARISPEYLFEGTDAMWWCPHGYAVAVVDARGSFLSEGDKYYYGRIIGLDGIVTLALLFLARWQTYTCSRVRHCRMARRSRMEQRPSGYVWRQRVRDGTMVDGGRAATSSCCKSSCHCGHLKT